MNRKIQKEYHTSNPVSYTTSINIHQLSWKIWIVYHKFCHSNTVSRHSSYRWENKLFRRNKCNDIHASIVRTRNRIAQNANGQFQKVATLMRRIECMRFNVSDVFQILCVAYTNICFIDEKWSQLGDCRSCCLEKPFIKSHCVVYMLIFTYIKYIYHQFSI